jgi:gliding motility-associated-like protein
MFRRMMKMRNREYIMAESVFAPFGEGKPQLHCHKGTKAQNNTNLAWGRSLSAWAGALVAKSKGYLALLLLLLPSLSQAQCVKPTFLQSVTITNPNNVALTNYVVKMTINTTVLQAASKLNNKFGFVFYDSDCVTQLNYWPSDANTFPMTNAVYYVKVPNLPASSSKTIVMYYDNATTCTQLITGTFSSIGTVASAPTVGFSAATTWELTNYTFPGNSTTFRWDVRSANTGNFRPKTTFNLGAQYVQAEGTSRAVAIGTNNYVDELPVDAGGHPGFFTPTLLNIAQNTGLNQNVNSGSGDIPPVSAPLTANVANTAQVQVYYRPRANAEPTVSFASEFNRTTAVTISPAGAVTACEEDILNFTASSPYINYRWYLDNIFRSAGAATTQSINTSGFSSGVHVLKVVAYTSACDSVQATKNITINSLSPDNGCQFSPLNYSANIGLNGSTLSTYAWDFGDATTGSGATPTHTYTIAANLNLRLIVTTTQGCKDTLTEFIAVYPKPTINSVAETDICWPNAVLFTSNTTIPSNWNASTISTHEWRYGDGANGLGINSSHAFALPNQYTDSMIVITNDGCRDTLTGSFQVWPKPDIASITDPNTCWPQTTPFSQNSSIPNNWNNATIDTYDWHFGDGTTGIGSVTTHAYGLPAFYHDSLMVITSDGCRDSLPQTISIWPKPNIDAVAALDQCWPNGTNFTATNSIANNWDNTTINIHDWRFGDASTGNTNPVFHTYVLPNVYTFTYYVQTGDACRDTFVDQVNIFPKPSINSLTESDICWPNAVLFTNNTTIPNNWDAATISVWDWRRGDGSTANTPTTLHPFAVPNLYIDTLYVTTTDLCKDTLMGSFEVWPKPAIDSIIVQDVCEPETMYFAQATQIPNNWNSATVNQYLWDFGDGQTGTGATVAHHYAVAGAYNVRLITITNNNCSDTLFKTVNVFPKPNAAYAITDICFGDSLHIVNTSTVAGTLGATIADYDWSFGDGDTSSVAQPVHWYNFEGLYTINMVVTTNHGCKDTLVQSLNVFPKPNASFSFPRTCQPDSVLFVDASTVSTGVIANYDWDFGDGFASILQNPHYQYAAADTYAVELIVTTDHGCLDTLERDLVWNPKPAAMFDFANVCFPDSIHFQDQTTLQFGNLQTWAWDFGDGNSATQTNIAHAYAAAGTYAVTLIVTSDSLCSDTLTLQATSNQKPLAAIAPATICWPDSVPFQDLSTIGGQAQITAWQWAFGDQDSAAVQNPMHYYAQHGSYPLNFIVWSDSGCTDTLDVNFVAFPRPGVQLGPDSLWLCPFNTLTLHAGPQYANYTWQDGSTDSTFVVNTPGVYSVTVVDTNGCIQSDTVETPLAPKPVLAILPNDTTAYCQESTVEIEAATPGIFSYVWSTGQTSSNITVSQAGIYTVIGYNQYLCADTVDVVVLEHDLPTPNIGVDTAFCFGDTVFVDAGAQYVAWQWSNGFTGQTFPFFYGGTFAVNVTDTNGCQAADTITLVRNPLPQIYLGPDSSLCQGDSIVLNAGLGYANYLWPNQGATTPKITLSVEDSAYVEVTDSNGCFNRSNTVYVTVDTLPAQPTITKGDMEIEMVSSPQVYYQWQFNGGTLVGAITQAYVPGETGTYQILVTDGNGCSAISDSFYIELEVYEGEMYQGISPNGDGVNDHFTVPEIEYYPNNLLIIYSRWGSEVYRQPGYLNQFEGLDSHDRSLADGVYYYVLDLGTHQKPIKGYLVIHR